MKFFQSDRNAAPEPLPREEMIKKLKYLMLFRVLFLSFFLGITILFQLWGIPSLFVPSLLWIYLLLGITFSLTIIYALLITRIPNLRVFCHAQISIDVLFTTVVIYVTGGIASAFSFIYFLPIFTAAILLYRKGAYLTASLSSILYGALIDLEYFGYIQPIHSTLIGPLEYGRGYVFYTLVINISAFYLLAFLSSYLSEREIIIGRKLLRKEIAYEDLASLTANIVQSMHSGLITTDPENKINFLNRAGEKILGVSLSEITGHQIEEYFPTIQLSRQLPVGLNGLSPRLEHSYMRLTGEQLYLGFSISPLRNSRGNEIGNIVIFQDLTLMKQMEESIRRSERLAAVGQLAAGMAHEIRNPLGAITGSIQMLSNNASFAPDERLLMEIVLRESDRLNILITDFLCFARPDKIHLEPVDLGKMIQEVLELVKLSPDFRKNTQIATQLEALGKIFADAQQIKQVLWNLYTNATQAMPDGGRLVTTLKPAKPINGSDTVVIEVTDTGVGIEQGDIQRVFDPFFTTRESGTGLGLSVVHRIVENHGGHISITSTKGKGTTVTIILPRGQGPGESKSNGQR